MSPRLVALFTLPTAEAYVTQSRLARLSLLVLLGSCMGSCVVSERPLIVGSKPILGEYFEAVLFRDFTEGMGYSSQKVGYHWANGFYTRGSATDRYLVRFAVEHLTSTDSLIERSQDGGVGAQAKVFTYFIARQAAEGAYLIAPLDENDLPSTQRDAICEKDRPEGFCAIKDHDQLIAFARASASKTMHNASVAVLTFGDERRAASAPPSGSQK